MTATDHPALTPALRWMSDMICLWSLCDSLACRRGASCARDPRRCLARYAPLTPEEAREGVMVMLDGLDAGLDYEALRDEAPDEIAAVEDWIARADASRRSPSRAAAPARAHAGGAPSARRPPGS